MAQATQSAPSAATIAFRTLVAERARQDHRFYSLVPQEQVAITVALDGYRAHETGDPRERAAQRLTEVGRLMKLNGHQRGRLADLLPQLLHTGFARAHKEFSRQTSTPPQVDENKPPEGDVTDIITMRERRASAINPLTVFGQRSAS